MIDLENLNYKELIALEKQIQEEKKKKIGGHLTKDDLFKSEDSKKIHDLLDMRFRDAKYGWPQKIDVTKFDWSSEEEKQEAKDKELPAPVAENMHIRINSSVLYLCDVAFKNYRDYSSHRKDRLQSPYYGSYGPNTDEPYYTVAMDKEIKWKESKNYKAMYDEILKVFLKYAKE